MNIIGDVEGRFCILVDDIVDSAGTLCNAAAALREAGARRRSSPMSRHGVLSGGAVARVEASSLDRAGDHRLDRGAPPPSPAPPTSVRLTIAPLLAEAIKRIADETSVSSLFD